jgi:hypothetical protein
MFTESSDARTYLRAAIAAILAGLTAAGTALVDDQSISTSEWVTIAIAVFGVLAAYLGVGAATIAEPFYGKRMRVEVPDSAVQKP